MIQSGTLYTAQELRSIGIGSMALSEARRSGIVVARELGKRLWYSGDELIRWSETKISTSNTRTRRQKS